MSPAPGSVPTIVVGGVASDVGKTSVATGLMAALRHAGHTVQGFKVGPDFIDPGYHAAATGRPPRNLDPFLVGESLIAPLFHHGTRGADVAVVEGVMGLFDGVAPTDDRGSTAHVARLLGAPVVLVVDAGAMARSAAAVVHGFATFDPDVTLAGVVFNRVGSEGHTRLLAQAVAPLGIPVLGGLLRDDALVTPSRHLGLVPVEERASQTAGVVASLAAWVRQGLDLAQVMDVARQAAVPAARPWTPPRTRPTGRAVRVAMAQGAAFTFRYTTNVELLVAAGAEVVGVDPLVDEALPPGTDVLYLGGGFPEVHAVDLAGNLALRDAVRRHAATGGTIVAECGGLLYLCTELDGQPMTGIIPAAATMDSPLTIGYRDVVAHTDNPVAAARTRLRGHEFHRSTTVPGHGGDRAAWTVDGRLEGFAGPRLHASYVHTHWAATPEVADRIVAAGRRPRT